MTLKVADSWNPLPAHREPRSFRKQDKALPNQDAGSRQPGPHLIFTALSYSDLDKCLFL